MFKLVLKKAALAIVVAALCYILIYFCAFLFLATKRVLDLTAQGRQIITYIICFIASVILILDLKLHNKQVKQEFFDNFHQKEYSIKNNFIFIWKSKGHWASLVVMNCILLFLEIAFGIHAQESALYIAGSVFALLIMQTFILSIFDCILWLIVFFFWKKKFNIESDN